MPNQTTTTPSRQVHWDRVYTTKAETEVSWFQERPAISLDLLQAAGATPRSAIIDIGGGASRLVDALVALGYKDVTVLDIAGAALDAARVRLGQIAASVRWVVADVTRWQPDRRYDLWHDRATFHFLVDEADRRAYVDTMRRALASGGHAVIGIFALDGPERCSGLPIVRYDAASLRATLGPDFALVESRCEEHRTPAGATQSFNFGLFRRR
jgi:SAM-dependent methyltransferase